MLPHPPGVHPPGETAAVCPGERTGPRTGPPAPPRPPTASRAGTRGDDQPLPHRPRPGAAVSLLRRAEPADSSRGLPAPGPSAVPAGHPRVEGHTRDRGRPTTLRPGRAGRRPRPSPPAAPRGRSAPALPAGPRRTGPAAAAAGREQSPTARYLGCLAPPSRRRPAGLTQALAGGPGAVRAQVRELHGGGRTADDLCGARFRYNITWGGASASPAPLASPRPAGLALALPPPRRGHRAPRPRYPGKALPHGRLQRHPPRRGEAEGRGNAGEAATGGSERRSPNGRAETRGASLQPPPPVPSPAPKETQNTAPLLCSRAPGSLQATSKRPGAMPRCLAQRGGVWRKGVLVAPGERCSGEATAGGNQSTEQGQEQLH